jgi:hypothetical protein
VNTSNADWTDIEAKRTFSLQLRNLSPRSLHTIGGCTVQPEGSAAPNIKGTNLARTRKDPAEEEELPLQVAPISYPKVTIQPPRDTKSTAEENESSRLSLFLSLSLSHSLTFQFA